MKISIFGLGYVGCVGMGCLASRGHDITGVDVSEEKIRLINEGHATIVENGIEELLSDAHGKGLVRATDDYVGAVMDTDITFLCVGTPSSHQGHLDLTYIFQSAHEIGTALKVKNGFHVVVIRSTVFPGTNEKVCGIIETESGKRRDVDFAVVSNPEFLREGTAVKDYMNPPVTVIGCNCDKALQIMKDLYACVDAPLEVVGIEVAEMIKYVNNSYHALKVVFANEVGSICKELGIDSHEVMRIFCMDRQLNISPYYFKPGFAYGGSCLPKDLLGLKTLAHDLYLDTPVLNSIDASNSNQIKRALDMIKGSGKKKIGILGLSFKAGTDDMRNSPIIDVIETLYGQGYEIRIFDKNVSLSKLIGKNKSVIREKLPHLDSLLKENLEDVCGWADFLVISNKDEEFRKVALRPGQQVLDLVRIKELEKESGYSGFSW